MPETILLKQSDVKNIISMKEIIKALESGFKAHAQNQLQMPPKEYLFFSEGDLRIMPCYVESSEKAGVKIVNVHPQNPLKKNLPTVMALIELVDPETGIPLAMIDGTWITDMRTGASAGVATKYLAKDDSKVVGIIGAGKQACTQLEALNSVMEIEEAKIFCRTCSSRSNFAKIASEKYGIDAKAVETPKDAVLNVDVLVTTTPSRKPLIEEDWVSPGTHINAMGADAPGKEELDNNLLKKSKIIIDSWEQASHSGEINIPVSQGLITQDDIYATLGEIVAGKKEGREGDEITIFDSTGLAVQDIVTAWEIYSRAIEKGLGQKIDFLS
jgi:alanine dehydrogenase